LARCFVTRRLPGGALDRLAADHELEVWPERLPPERGELRDRVRDVEGLLCLLTDPIDRELIEGAPRLRAISNYAVGSDNVDVEAATARGIPVGNTPDVLTETTSDLAFALMLSAARRLGEGEREVRAGNWLPWDPSWLLGHDVHGAVLGIVGFGRIGRAVARRAEGFEMEVLHALRDDGGTGYRGTGGKSRATVPRARDGGVPLDELLERSDFVSLHCPLTDATRGLIGESELRRMKQTAILVNTARGPIVQTAALERALREGWIAGAALDVTDPEPLPRDHHLLTAPNLTVVPHLGSATHATREAMADMAVDNLLAALRGEPMPHCVNPEVYAP
jgi:glyoxylate reductase